MDGGRINGAADDMNDGTAGDAHSDVVVVGGGESGQGAVAGGGAGAGTAGVAAAAAMGAPLPTPSPSSYASTKSPMSASKSVLALPRVSKLMLNSRMPAHRRAHQRRCHPTRGERAW
jgi:hypothetical protein